MPSAAVPAPQPGYFGTRPVCYGVLHRPAEATRRGVVIVNDFGHRGLCVYWSFRRLAQRLAAEGSRVLRFDLPGTGESPAMSGNRVDSWPASVAEAIAALRAHEDIEEITLIGYGLGALLAFDEAQRQPLVTSVELIQPYASGEQYLEAVAPAATAGPTLAGGRLVSQHFLSATEERSLRRLAPSFGPREPPLDVQVVSLAAGDSDPFLKKLAQAGVAVRVQVSASGPSWTKDPSHGRIPDFFDALAERLRPRSPATHAARDVSLRTRHVEHGAGYEEEAVACPAESDGSGELLYATLATPVAKSLPRALVFFFGTADNRRTGIHDNNTLWGRALAGKGIATLRFDASGFGDSNARPGFQDNEVLVDRNVTDAAPLLAEMQRRGFTEFGSTGLSSGAYTALQFARMTDCFYGVLGINTARFVLRQTFEEAMRAEVKTTRTYWAAARKPETWLRLLRGDVDVGRIAPVLVNRLRARAGTQLKLALGRLRGKQEVVLSQGHQEMVEFLGRQRRKVQLIFAFDDRGVEEYEAEFGAGGVALKDEPNIEVTFLPGIDHSITNPDDARRVGELAAAFFGRVFAG